MRWADGGRVGTVLILGVAGALLYAASRTAAAALAGSGGGRNVRPGWRAVGHWVPIAATSIVAAARGHADVAVALAFATSVGCLSFVLGVLTYLAPMDQLPAARRAWPFVLPAALLALIAGFSGHVSWLHAVAMVLLGIALMSVWRDPSLQEPAPTPSPFADSDSQPLPKAGWFRIAELLVAIALAVVGGWYAVDGTVRAAAAARLFPAATLAVVILSPLVTLPMLNPAAPDSPAGQTASTVSTLVAVGLLNLCALLPLLSFLWLFKTAFAAPGDAIGVSTAATNPTSVSLFSFLAASKPLPFPLASWRVDAVVLTVLGFILIPVSLGRWELRRAEAIGLIVGYAAYLVLVAFASVRT